MIQHKDSRNAAKSHAPGYDSLQQKNVEQN